jgi:hypothetical protein
MRFHDLLQHDGQHDQQAREECDRHQMSHSFSPYLSTAKLRSGFEVP